MDRLVEHQSKIENFFNNYYEVLDDLRKMVLQTEYKLQERIKAYEYDLQELLNRTQQYKIVDFYFEQKTLEKQISELVKSLNFFGYYLPQYDLIAQKTPIKQMKYEE